MNEMTKDEAYREALRHLSPELIGETVASGIDIRLFIEVGIDAGYEAAEVAERERRNRIIKKLESKVKASPIYGDGWSDATRRAIEIVKGGEDETNK